MALLTPMSLAEAQALGVAYGLQVTALDPIARGSVNSNFGIHLADGSRAFIRVCEESSRSEVERQNRLLKHLVANEVPTPIPHDRVDGGGTVTEHHGKPVALFDFCEGDWRCQASVDTDCMRVVGAAVARVHLAGEGYSDAPVNRFGFDQLFERLAQLGRLELDETLTAVVEHLGARLKELVAVPASTAPLTVIHGDVFRDNVLWKENGELSAVLDFESASQGSAAFDLMVTMLAWCYGDDLDRSLVSALLTGYQSVRALSEQEFGACYDQARVAALRFAITRITDYELRPRGVVVFKDYRRFVARLAALEHIGREGFVDFLTAG